MSLPKIVRIHGLPGEITRMQGNIAQVVDNLSSKEILDGSRVSNASIGTSTTAVQHKLGRIPLGWILISKNLASDIYEVSRDDKFLNLKATAAVTCSLWVF